jgi:hypothetical protein
MKLLRMRSKCMHPVSPLTWREGVELRETAVSLAMVDQETLKWRE